MKQDLERRLGVMQAEQEDKRDFRKKYWCDQDTEA